MFEETAEYGPPDIPRVVIAAVPPSAESVDEYVICSWDEPPVMEIVRDVNGIPPVLTTWALTIVNPDAPTLISTSGESPVWGLMYDVTAT